MYYIVPASIMTELWFKTMPEGNAETKYTLIAYITDPVHAAGVAMALNDSIKRIAELDERIGSLESEIEECVAGDSW